MKWEKEYERLRDMGHTWGPGVDDVVPLTEEEQEAEKLSYEAFQQKLRDYTIQPRPEFAEAGKALKDSLPPRSDIVFGRAPHHWREEHSAREIALCQKAAASLGYTLELCSEIERKDKEFSIKIDGYGYISDRVGNIHPYIVTGIKSLEDCLQLVADFVALGTHPTIRYDKGFCYSTDRTGQLRWELESRYGCEEFLVGTKKENISSPQNMEAELESLPVEICLARAKNPGSSPETLRCLSRHSFWFVRDFVASNPSAPPDCLSTLVQDQDVRVRTEAKRNLESRSGKKAGLDFQIQAASCVSEARLYVDIKAKNTKDER